METDKNIPTDEEIQEWLSTTELLPFVDVNDVGKQGKILKIRWSDTKYGRKLAIDIEFSDGEKKTMLLGKIFTKDLFEENNINSVSELIGRNIIIDVVKVATSKGLVAKPKLKLA